MDKTFNNFFFVNNSMKDILISTTIFNGKGEQEGNRKEIPVERLTYT